MAETLQSFAIKCLRAFLDHVDSGQASPEDERKAVEFRQAMFLLGESGPEIIKEP